MSLLKQLRHDLLFKARLSIPEVDTLLALPELASETITPQQKDLQSILRQSPEAAVLQAAIGTFQRDLVGRPVDAEAASDAEVLVSDLDPQPAVITTNNVDLTASLVDQPGSGGD